MNSISHSVQKLLTYVESESYRGYDPYDALLSPIFIHPWLSTHKKFRFAAQQFLKRFPINLRPFLSIPKGLNPVTLGLCVQSYTNLMKVFPKRKTEFISKGEFMISELKRLIPEGYHGACWGYDFPWQSRYAEIPAYQPTVVATGIITNALFQFYRETGHPGASELCKSAAEFILSDLNRSFDASSFCFSYSPFDHQCVYNASTKAIRLLSQVYYMTKDESLLPVIRGALEYIMSRQAPDGSWNYSEAGKWIDNYHTGYVLDCLHEYTICTGDTSIMVNLQAGFEFFSNNFLSPEGSPKLIAGKMYPIDCTAAGQSMLTLIRYNDIHSATRMAEWMIEHMQSPDGYFYYRKNRAYIQKTSFMRWSNAWMLAGLTGLLITRN